MICMPTFGELADELAEVAPQALDLQPDHPVLELDLGNSAASCDGVAAAVDVGLVDVDRAGRPGWPSGRSGRRTDSWTSASRAARECRAGVRSAAADPREIRSAGGPAARSLPDSGAAKAPLSDRNP